MDMRIVTIFAMSCLFAFACDEGAQPEASAQAAETDESSDAAQRVEVRVNASGYEPSSIEARAGQPLTLVVTRTTDEGCGQVLAIPSQDIRRDLPLNEAVEISFTPNDAGNVRFTCGMGMYDGTIVVQ